MKARFSLHSATLRHEEPQELEIAMSALVSVIVAAILSAAQALTGAAAIMPHWPI